MVDADEPVGGTGYLEQSASLELVASQEADAKATWATRSAPGWLGQTSLPLA